MSTTGSITVTSRVTYMFQDAVAALNPLRKVRWQVEEALRASGVPRARRAGMVLDYLSRCGLPDPEKYARRYPHELSGGLAQRVLLATVLATGPALVIADEPTSALDVTTQAGIVTLFRRLIDEDHLGLVLITHDLTVAAHLADEIAVMTGGRVVEQASPRELFSNPIDPYTKRLVDALPRRSRTIAEEVAR
jgi:ABC-type dipeptide/oligopeptide/nickel transport system ATPase component